jgi:hypothetical protein
MKIGFTGVPPYKIIEKYKNLYPNAQWIDLDVPIRGISRSIAVDYIPETTCSIIQTIISNSTSLRPDLIIASVGKGKCDSMSFIIPIIKRTLKDIKIIEIENNEQICRGNPICTSDIPLIEKFDLITNTVTNGPIKKDIKISKATAGYWGVPPYDYSLLELFPNNTHIFGWTRCMENGTPNNLELELYIDSKIPTVFYSQSFCAKNILAKELAKSNKGLYVEVDGPIDNSTKEKIKAFLELNNCF